MLGEQEEGKEEKKGEGGRGKERQKHMRLPSCSTVTCVCMYMARVPGVYRGHRVFEPLELELQVMSHRVGAQNWSRVLCKNSECSGLPRNLPSTSCIHCTAFVVTTFLCILSEDYK